MYKVLVFAGTTEGYEICRFLADHKIETKGFVATEYGSKSLTNNFSLFRPEDWMQQPWRRPFTGETGNGARCYSSLCC